MIAEYTVVFAPSKSRALHVDVHIRTVRQFSSFGYGIALTATSSREREHGFLIDVGGVTLPQINAQQEGPAQSVVSIPVPQKGEAYVVIRRKTDVVECLLRIEHGKATGVIEVNPSDLFTVELQIE